MNLPSITRLAALACSAAVLLLTGCSLQTSGDATSSVDPVALPAFQGKVMGGESPIAGSNIILWETDPANGGYASTAAVKLGTTTGSTPGGNFGFTTGYTCTPGQFVYITSTGGDTSNGSGSPVINNNLVLMAALGSCSNFGTATAQGNVTVILNELSTIAAAYALDGFMTVVPGTTGKQLVYVGAPAKNNAATGSCSGTGTAMTCSSAGLAHAFANAANLVDAVHYDGTEPTGAARTTVPGNLNSSVPTAVINTLGNILQFCTNSAGGNPGDGSACGSLFADATPTATGATSPTDTLTALMNVARQPYVNIGTTCTGTTGGLFCLANSFASFQPSLTAVPHDWTIAIVYPGSTQTIPISSYTYSSPTITLNAPNSLIAGQTVTLSGFPAADGLDGQFVTVSALGLSSTQFQATFTAYSITAYSITSNVATFTTSSNTFTAGQPVTLSNFPTSTFLNGQTVIVSSTGLTLTSFQATVASHADVATTTEAGKATATPVASTDSGTGLIDGSPQSLALDANDSVYVEIGNTYTPTVNGLMAMSSTGSVLWSLPQSNLYCAAGEVATDIPGNVWLSVNEASSSTGCSYNIYGFNAASASSTYVFQPSSTATVCNVVAPTANCPGYTAGGDNVHKIQSTPNSIAFDRFNNLWYARNSSSCTQCVFELPYTAGSAGALGTFGAPTTIEGASGANLASITQMIIDTNSNVWLAGQSTTSGVSGILYDVYNTGTALAPTYTATSGFIKVSLPTYDNGGLGIDSAANVWAGSNLNIVEYTPTGSGASSTFGSPAPALDYTITGTHPFNSEVDGGGVFFTGSLTSSGAIFITNTPTSVLYNSTTVSKDAGSSLRPCYVPNGNTTCDSALTIGTTAAYVTGDPKTVQVDSAGALWVAAGVASTSATGYIVQILGVASPTWPTYAYDVLGAKPQ